MAPSDAATRRARNVALLLVVAVALIYARILGHEFTTFDDPQYVWSNEFVQRGLTLDGLRLAFMGPHAVNWHPLTTLSHLVDVELWGSRPEAAGGHLAGNVLLHAANAVLLLRLMLRLTGSLAGSALVAALFALHPLRVESVAWVAERKDVLCGFFSLLALDAYARYARAPLAGGRAKVGLWLVAALMSKPSAVTLPCVFLLLDYWPLGRFLPGASARETAARLWPLVSEKLPFFALVAATSVVTWWVQKLEGAVFALDALPWGWRLVNIPVAYVRYLGMMLWPRDLAAFYPHPGTLIGSSFADWVGAALASTAVLAVLTALVLRRAATQPWLAMGWFWFLGTLVPMIGLVQVGSQSHADRYTYFSGIGLAIAGAWTLREIWRGRPELKPVVVGAAGLGLLVLAGASRRQASVWRDSRTLYEHGVRVVTSNFVMHYNLGNVYLHEDRMIDASIEFRSVLVSQPEHAQAMNNLGTALIRMGVLDEAHDILLEAVAIKPDYHEARVNLGVVLERLGQTREAWKHYAAALRLDPDSRNARARLGLLLANTGLPELAIPHLEIAVQRAPEHSELVDALARARADSRRASEEADRIPR